MYSVRARCYHPLLGMWTSRDPLGLIDGLSLLAYAGSNSPNATDPSGYAVATRYIEFYYATGGKLTLDAAVKQAQFTPAYENGTPAAGGINVVGNFGQF